MITISAEAFDRAEVLWRLISEAKERLVACPGPLARKLSIRREIDDMAEERHRVLGLIVREG